EDDHCFAADIDTGVIVVTKRLVAALEVLGGDAVAGENERRIETAAATDGQWIEGFAELQFNPSCVVGQREPIVVGRSQLGWGRDFEFLKRRAVKQVSPQS